MPTLLSIEALEADRRFVQHQVEEAEDDIWGTVRLMWQHRLQEIDEQIAVLSALRSDLASVAIFFDGLPVIGQSDIRLSFATKALSDYQDIVSTAYAARLVEALPTHGPLPGRDRSRLFIRDVARGSFGFILEEIAPEQRELLPSLLKEVVEESTSLISTLVSAEDETFETALELTQQRLIVAVTDFAKTLFDAKASTRIVADERQVTLSTEDVGRLSNRLAEITIQDIEEFVDGRLMGVLPDEHRFEFEFLDGDRGAITGSISEDLVQKYVADEEFRRRALVQPVRAMIKRTRTIRNNRQVREQFSLETVELLGEVGTPTSLF
jgi:hypothetical protein